MQNDEGSYYKQTNCRKSYWLYKECLKHLSPCSAKCPGYLSVAQARRKYLEKQGLKIR